jgi:glutathione reductase (NADPH)
MTYDYDLFVIGAGSGGVRAARIAAGHGAKVAIAEEKHLGGTCVNVGCVPKKLLAYASDFRAHFEDAKNFGWTLGNASFDWKTLIQNKDSEIKRLNGIYNKLLSDSGADIFDGKAKFIDNHTIEVNGKTVTADKVLIATGGKPNVPNFPGKEHAITSDDAFYLPDLPKRTVIIGGGYIGVEFAHILSGMGSQVTLLHRGKKLLKGFDEDIRQTLGEEMQKQDHLSLKFDCEIAKVEKKNNELIVHTKDGDTFNCDVVLAATGRIPNSHNLGLENTDVTQDNLNRVIVNDNYQSNASNIYAVGDVCNNHNLTPVATAEGHVLADRLYANLVGKKVSYDFIPTAVFSLPPVSSVGFTEQQAIDKGFNIDVYISKFTPMKHTVSKRDEKTMMKMLVDKDSDRVIGIHMVGMDAPEIMQGFAVAINSGAKKADFDRTIGIHPTSAEEFVTMRTPKVKKTP